MKLHFIVMAAALAGSAAVAETPKSSSPHSAPAQQPQPRLAVLAANDAVKADAAQGTQPTPAEPKHRFARVTTCRCGDPQPADSAEDGPEQ